MKDIDKETLERLAEAAHIVWVDGKFVKLEGS